MTIKELKNKIEEQREENISLFKIFQYRLHEKEMQPTIKKWREGSNKIKGMIKELQLLELKNKKIENKNTHQVFINGYGEATNRDITSSLYQRNQKRLAKDILSFLGCK
jgi:hypothetical protein